MKRIIPVALITGLAACGSDTSTQSAGSTNVTQAGAKDFARFREVVAKGEVPAPSMLDEVGFFAEHALDLPPADCGRDVCFHPSLAVAPTFDGGNWTMAFIAMNTAVDAARLSRPSTHLVIAVERHGDTEIQKALADGVAALVGALRPDDRVSLLVYDLDVTVLAKNVSPDASVATALVNGLGYWNADQPAMYEALARASLLLDDTDGLAEAKRIVLVTSGKAGGPINDPRQIVGLAEALAKEGTSLDVITTPLREEIVMVGIVGADVLPRLLGQVGAGTVAHAEDGPDLVELLRQEGRTSMFPLATDLEIRVEAARGYRVGRTYGAPRATVEGNVAILRTPAAFLGLRDGASNEGESRRGGGGGLFVELIADPAMAREIGPHAPAYVMKATFVEARSGEDQLQRREMDNVLAPGVNPPPTWPSFSDPSRGKAFMMLNMYLGLRAAVDFHHTGDCPRAKGLIDQLRPMTELWLTTEPDSDIEGDYTLMLDLRANVEKSCAAVPPVTPRNVGAGCFGL